VQYRGTGIQKAEEHLQALFPAARIARMDQDTTRRKGAHVSILESVARREIDILLGTQMVAKGLDFPGVALVGVLQADTGLHIPDFRASEKTFQLLTQVAGRAGRADNLGEVIVQTYLPDDPSVRTAANHDYTAFVTHELDSREELRYPPFCRLARIVVSGPAADQVRALAERIGRALRGGRDNVLTVVGPAPAVLERVKATYRFSLLIKSTSAARLRHALAGIRRTFGRDPNGCRYMIDVDPVSML